ncbi:MAG: GH3 auxin-responsive promoter family protein [Phycisphaerales bacterium]|nr:GH3 auxin-responsive promoter family protein [Phycisphaerales bacterium]
MRTHAPTPIGHHTWTSLVGVALHGRVQRRRRLLSNLDYWKTNSQRIQLNELGKLVKHCRNTRIGQGAGFTSLAQMEDQVAMLEAFRERLPVSDWYAFQDDIVDMREHGHRDVLWPGKVMHFAQTSGTTAGDKFIAVTEEMMRSNYLASLDIFAHLINRGVYPERIMGGRCLFLGGSTDLEVNEHDVATGDLSGLVTPLIKWPLSTIYSPGPDIALMDHWPSKIEAMAQRAIDQDIRFISGMPSWALVLIDRVIEIANERGNPARCARDVWPNLEVFVHGGVNYVPFIERMCRAFSGDPTVDFPCRQELYPASEGFIAIQDMDDDPAMRLLTDNGIFYEFVPLEQIDDENPDVFTCWQVDKGQKYVVVMTTNAGLWRYVIGDVVEFDSIPDGIQRDGSMRLGDGPARIRIVGRHRHFINAFGENLIGEHIEHGVAAAVASTGLETGEFTAAPVYPSENNRAGLELAVEFSMLPSDEQLQIFCHVFDQSIKDENVDYTTKRSDGLGMDIPTITALPMGTFHRWLDAKGKLGGQHKCPRCANHREIINEITAVAAQQFAG